MTGRGRWLLWGLVLLVGAAPAASGRSFEPAPRDERGRFLNAAGEISHAGVNVTLPFQLRRVWATLVGRHAPLESVPNDGAFLRHNASHSAPTATWVGHSTLLVQMEGLTFLTDPIWSKTASPISWAGPRRYVPPGVALDDLPPVDFVLVSHNHYDHLDLASLERLARRDPLTRFLVPLGNAELLRSRGIQNVDELDWGDTLSVAGVRATCLPAQHWSRRGLFDGRSTLWCSWSVVGPERRFYFAGDSGYFDGYAAIGEALGPFDLAALPIGAYEPQAMMRPYHLDPEEAVRAGRDLRARRIVGVHFGTFDLSDEPMDEPPRRFLEAAREDGYAAADAWILRIGETREF